MALMRLLLLQILWTVVHLFSPNENEGGVCDGCQSNFTVRTERLSVRWKSATSERMSRMQIARTLESQM